MRAAGWVLTGGKSSRMGTDKALLEYAGTALVAHIAEALGAVADPVMLVGEPTRYGHLPWRCLEDVRPGLGPLSGLETALAQTGTEWNFVAGCDMPALPEPVLAAMRERACRSDAKCVAVRDGTGRVHPLLAMYRASCLGSIRRALDEGRLRLTALLHELSPEIVQVHSAVANVNTPEEWARWLKNR